MDRPRYIESACTADLDRKMVFIAGPRQVGKATLARRILSRQERGTYLSWDRRDDRLEIRAARWPDGPTLVVLDELHKWRGWKRWLKGEFDKHRSRVNFLVTGSARLDVFRRGSDSLQGRYHHYRLHPFSAAEVRAEGEPDPAAPGRDLDLSKRGDPEAVLALLEFGGFPEPFLAQSARTLRRWQKERLDRFFREDVRDLEPIRDMSSLQLLADMLPDRVGSLLSLNALREDLEVSHRAVTHWVDVLERMYHMLRLLPFGGPRTRSLKKQPKAYLWDWSLVPDRAARFENLVALHLLKLCHFIEDRDGFRMGLHFLRARDGREVDFLTTVDGKPWFAVEVKLAASRVDPALLYFKERLRLPRAYQVTLEGNRDFVEGGVHVLPAARFLAALV